MLTLSTACPEVHLSILRYQMIGCFSVKACWHLIIHRPHWSWKMLCGACCFLSRYTVGFQTSGVHIWRKGCFGILGYMLPSHRLTLTNFAAATTILVT